jgi:hypothetical protein
MAGMKDLLKKAASAKPASKSKSKTPEVQRDDLNEAIDKWLEASRMEKDAEALKAQAEAVILPEAESERVKASMNDGEFHSSVKINGKITTSVQSRYSPVDPANEDAIKGVVGAKFDEFFKTKTDVGLKPAILEDEAAMGKIVAAIGEENFGKFFDVKQSLTVSNAFHEQRAVSKDVKDMADKLISEGLVKPYKAAVKKA